MTKTHTLVLNADYVPIQVVDSRSAFINLYKENVLLVEDYDDKVFRTSTTEYPVPAIVRTRRYVKLPYRRATLSKRNIHKRDKFTCAYCGDRYRSSELTVDHIIPRSRGGKNTWENLVTSCWSCNNQKGDRTPMEWGRERPITSQPHYLVLMNNFGMDGVPDIWKPFLFH